MTDRALRGVKKGRTSLPSWRQKNDYFAPGMAGSAAFLLVLWAFLAFGAAAAGAAALASAVGVAAGAAGAAGVAAKAEAANKEATRAATILDILNSFGTLRGGRLMRVWLLNANKSLLVDMF
jgi:hypothetical protein